ncbi:MAG: RNA methyltransferase [Flavobacteriaceae bacterium]|nr:RNA methyltransferase [Flavobacteriaceae bacterium]
MKEITSFQNPSIKNLVLLQSKSKARRDQNVFLVEGQQEIELCVSGGFEFVEVYFCPDYIPLEQVEALVQSTEILNLVHQKIYRKIAYRGSTEGLVAVVKTKANKLQDLVLESKAPLILVAEAPEKPGNIGALLRTADACGADAVLIADLKTDLYHPNIIRSSVGTVFTNQIGLGTSEEIIQFLDSHNIPMFCAILQEAKDYTLVDYTGATALVMGTESTGLTEIWREASHQNIIIPMQGEVDSMNVSVASGILLFEAVRQRKQ